MANPSNFNPEKARDFAVQVVRRLRDAGYEAYWAGGCVRDQLLERRPKDYDVASDARPEEVRELFKRKRTLALGAAFGVITVLGPPGAGQIEVATFREDLGYSDGRHPDAVRYSTAEADARRRDFTINGLFFDPLENRVIDFVGGREDLRRRMIRAIGDPDERFSEDKLRMLRAIRFSSTFEFSIEEATFEAIRRMSAQIRVVSPERIAAEMRRVLPDNRRAVGAALLVESGLAAAILPELPGAAERDPKPLEPVLSVLDLLDSPGFPLALAVLLSASADAEGAMRVGERWRLSNKEIGRTAWLLEHRAALVDAQRKPWSSVQPVLVAEGAGDLLNWMAAERRARGGPTEDVQWCRAQMAQPADRLDPKPLINGDDLMALGVPLGPIYGEILERVRRAQLDEEVGSPEAALAMAERIVREK